MRWMVALCCACSSFAATLPADWQKTQRVDVHAPGLVKVSLPTETLDAARAALEDLRLYDDNGNELPYFIERPKPASRSTQSGQSFLVSLNANTTVITFDTGLTQPVDAVTLESPATDFIKPIIVEGSVDGRPWQTLGQGQPVFRQPNGAAQLGLAIPVGSWRSLRLTVDDRRSSPIPFTGARVHTAAAEPTPGESFSVAIAERHENPGETRLRLNLGAANLDVASLQIDTSEPLFTREVTIAVPQVTEDGIRERTLAQDTIYRVALDDRPSVGDLSVAVESQVRSRELILLIQNDDSPPLSITSVRAVRRPVYLVFLAKYAGIHHVVSGNAHCPPPRYDLAVLSANLKAAPVSAVTFSPPSDNSDFRLRDMLAEIELAGTTLDISPWTFRKAIQLLNSGAQQLELDLEVLAHAQPGFQDLRLMRGDKQVPYVLERTSIRRTLTPTVTVTSDPKNKSISRWTIALPQANLPVTRLSCTARTPLFQRDVTLYEELTDERGEKYRSQVAGGNWTQTPNRKGREFVLALDGPLRSNTLILETHNGDNPPIELENFRLFHPATRMLFKAKTDDELMVYYGNPLVASPRYDLSLVAGQLLAAEKSTATLVAEHQLKQSSWAESRTPGKGGLVFWGILALVVVGLLVVISRLLPKSSPEQKP